MAVNELGVTIPAGGDVFDPQGDMVALANSFKSRVVVPVANTTERAALAAAISWVPTAEEPLRVSRGDADPGRELEYTTNGTDWLALMAARAETVEDVSLSTGTGLTASTSLGTATAITAATYDRVVEVYAILNYSVSAASSWQAVVTSSGAVVTSNTVGKAIAPWSPDSAVGGSATVATTFALAAGATAEPRLWAQELSGTGTFTPTTSTFQVRVRPKF